MTNFQLPSGWWSQVEKTRVHGWLILAAAAAAACSPGQNPARVPELPYAAATSTCGPADGPAIGIYLASSPIEMLNPAPPYAYLYIFHSLEEVTGRTWQLGEGSADGTASWVAAPDQHQPATTASVTIDRVEPDRTVVGEVDLLFPGDRRIQGRFEGRWIEQTMLCG